MRVRSSLLSCFALALLAAGCREAAAGDARVETAATVEVDTLTAARTLLRAVEAGRRHDDIDRTVSSLAADGRGESFTVAGKLLAARWRATQSERDKTRAEDYLRSASGLVRDGAVGCEARGALVRLLRDAGEAAGGTRARTDYTTHCGALPADLEAPRTVAPVVAPAARTAAVRNGRYRRVVLDPGHGGSDPGAIGPGGLRESTVTLDVARRVAERLAVRYGVQVVLTRDRDVYVPLEERAAHANDSGADVFVSIHCNAAGNAEAHGVSTFVLEYDSDRVAARVLRREGELVDFDGARDTADVTHILADLRLSQHGRDSLGLAREVQGSMLHDARLLYPAVDDMGVHPARFHVLVTARMPAVLVELSFISNAMEERRLGTEAYRDVLASAIARALGEHR